MGTVRQPGNNTPGIEGVQEKATDTQTLADGTAAGTATLSLSGAYDGTPDLVGVTFEVSGGGSASEVTGYTVQNRSAGSIEVAFTVDNGTGSNDVRVVGWADGDAAK
jgi:hypothetical protein